MPYKDTEQAKEASKLRMQKMRQGVTGGATNQGVTGKGVTRIEFIQQELNDPYLVQGIEEASRIKWQIPRDLRYERAYIYKLKREGKVTGSIIGRDIEELRQVT